MFKVTLQNNSNNKIVLQNFSIRDAFQKKNCSEGDIGPFSFYPLPP